VVLAIVFTAWVAFAWPAVRSQGSKTLSTWYRLAPLSGQERALAIDPVAIQVARDIAAGVPDTGCVTVLAYAGEDARAYYRGRLAYLLYPRHIRLAANSRAGDGSGNGDCEFLSVFRDTAANLRQSPYTGKWDQAELDQRLANLPLVHQGQRAVVYRVAPVQGQ
jgi:hypothetical protein